MTQVETHLPGVLLLHSETWRDERGFFVETFSEDRPNLQDTHGPARFVQDNWSRSRAGVLRGLHWQSPMPQGKLVRCVRGRIWDVAVDITQGSPTYCKWFGVELNDENHHSVWIPAGYAHGFLTLSDWADVVYKCSGFTWQAAHEKRVRWDDPDIGIQWPLDDDARKSGGAFFPWLSEKDAAAPFLKDLHRSTP